MFEVIYYNVLPFFYNPTLGRKGRVELMGFWRPVDSFVSRVVWRHSLLDLC